MAMLDSALNNYLSTYRSPTVSRHDSHRRSELRKTYNSMVKVNSESPVYKLADDGDAKNFAVTVKGQTHEIQNAVASMTDAEEGIDRTLHKKVAVSSEPDVVGVSYIGDSYGDSPGFEVRVQQLATPQINLGKYLSGTTRSFSPGTYSFDLETASDSYEFEFNVTSSDTNFVIQRKIANLINHSNIGLKASIIQSEDKKHNALRIESKQVGLPEDDEYQFSITHSGTADSEQALATLGINYVESPAKNTEFLLNDKLCTSHSNMCTVNKAFQLSFNSSALNKTVQIGFKPDADAVVDNIRELTDCYNSMIGYAQEYADSETGTPYLLHTYSKVALDMKKELDELGLNIAPNGSIELDKDTLTKTLSSDKTKLYKGLTSFAETLQSTADNISLDPLRYVKKLVLFYKKPGNNLNCPYISSAYAGMLLDLKCNYPK